MYVLLSAIDPLLTEENVRLCSFDLDFNFCVFENIGNLLLFSLTVVYKKSELLRRK